MWSLILHGGARDIAPKDAQANRDGVRRALLAGSTILQRGGSALDAAVAALCALEDDPTFNAGTGSVQRADGKTQMCSALMEGDGLGIGAVTLVSAILNPVRAARLVLAEKPILLGGEGADAFAIAHGLAPGNGPAPGPGRPGCDTVGCVALDQNGLLVAGTSTGGLESTANGRIGDSPLPGCGYYADRRLGACALSGDGEEIARLMLAARILLALPAIGPEASVRHALDQLTALGGEAGVVLLTPDGHAVWDHTSTGFAVALCSALQPEPEIHLAKAAAGGPGTRFGK